MIYNYLFSFISEQNIKLLYSDSQERTNIIIQNSVSIHIYASSKDKY